MQVASTSGNGLAPSTAPIEIVSQETQQQALGSSPTTDTAYRALERDNHQPATFTGFDTIHQPADLLDIGEFTDVNEFYVSYWIEQMKHISQFPIDDPNSDLSWNLPIA